MILTGVYRRRAVIAGCFLGESGWREVPPITAMVVEPEPAARVGSPGIWIAKSRFRRSLAVHSDQRIAPACV